MIFALAATLAIVAGDHTMLRAAPRAGATVLASLSQGETLEVREERAGYLKVYDYRRERAGYLRIDTVRELDLTAASAPELLAILRFLRDSPGSEALGISYGAAYLKAAPVPDLTAEPLDAIARMAERLADAASSSSGSSAATASHLEAVQQYGVHMRSFENNGQVQVCYDGELYQRVLTLRDANAEQRAHAVLGLTRPECIDPDSNPVVRAALDQERGDLLEAIDTSHLGATMKSRIHARRAAVWASIAFEQARRGAQPVAASERAMSELLSVRADDLGDDRRSEYLEALLRVGAIRSARESPAAQTGPFVLSSATGDPGQTCVSVHDARRGPDTVLVRRCTYGIVWMASVRAFAPAPALVLAVQPLDGWRELWVFHQRSGVWAVEVLSPSSEGPELGYVEFAGYAANSHCLLIAREAQEHGRFVRRFEELRLEGMTVIHQAGRPDLLRDFARWQDAAWRRETLSQH